MLNVELAPLHGGDLRNFGLVLLVLGNLSHADTSLDRVVNLFMSRQCTGCHQGATARFSLASFTTAGGERELMKSFAYRHYQMRARVLKELGQGALKLVRYLESPTIDPPGKTAELFANALTRDGEVISESDWGIIDGWFTEGAPLPADVLDEVFAEIREYAGQVGRH